MQKIRLDKSNDRVQLHYLYDLTLPLPERYQQRMPFVSAIAAAVFLGVSPARIYVSRSHKHRIWSEAQGKWFAVRIGTEKPTL